jgi:hypothetical protein
MEVTVKIKPAYVQTDEHKTNIKAGKQAAQAQRLAQKAAEEAEKKKPRIITNAITGASKPMPSQIAQQLGWRI